MNFCLNIVGTGGFIPLGRWGQVHLAGQEALEGWLILGLARVWLLFFLIFLIGMHGYEL
jgi:hypothetical protein